MAVREVKIFPDPILREKAKTVTQFDEELKKLAEDMVETMNSSDGVGLAAPQVGESLRVITINTTAGDEEENTNFILVNPEIVEKEGEIVWNEGCLSFPGIYEEIKRADKVKVNAVDLDGVKFTIQGEGLMAVALQHEIDHLNGILIFDYMSYIRKKLVKRELKKKIEKMKEEAAENRQDIL